MSDHGAAGPGDGGDDDSGRRADEPSPERVAGMRFLTPPQHIELVGPEEYERQMARLRYNRPHGS